MSETPSSSTAYYFAYGSNLNHEVREVRRGLQPLWSTNGVLNHYQLTFNHKGLGFLEPAFASLDSHPDSQVHGMVYQLSEKDQERLHATEGSGYQVVPVTVETPDHGPLTCFTYITRDPVQGLSPSRRYLHKIIAGARENQLPESYIQWLMSVDSVHIPILSNLLDRYIATMIRSRLKGRRRSWLSSRLGVRLDD
ncbi:gamma-glutamylcyclotransferase family protein [Parendozoicomonas haliclonae]|uniref:AIG2-like family protein n=1 Tax=Parendozoicomonas haliclonae TaxID=1960125 RepID=A0A1X7AMY7_9GAMM|nr:gamma-glutamylcyclotransferase family protein [Parendozoicomonas haliclonae]SMA49392.1 AIG2-like family protein [Parendozoicomonas haliclonae]